MITNWKTSLAGVAAILTALGDALTQLLSGNVGGGQLEKDALAIIVGLGLVVARDHNK